MEPDSLRGLQCHGKLNLILMDIVHAINFNTGHGGGRGHLSVHMGLSTIIDMAQKEDGRSAFKDTIFV